MDENITIMGLGGTGSGKTVYLASLYTWLMNHYAFTGFNLRAEDAGYGTNLQNAYFDMLRGKDWPPRNFEGERHTFRLMGSHEGRSGEISRIHYWDYPGGWLIDATQRPSTFMQDAKRASAIFCMLDGEHVADALNHQPVDLMQIISSFGDFMQEAENADIQYIVTKWDYVESLGTNGTELSDIKNLIQNMSGWPNIEETCRANGHTVMLIPISSVGRGFCRRVGTGQFEFIAGAQPDPINLLVPFAMTLEKLAERRMIEVQDLAQGVFAGKRQRGFGDAVDEACDALDELLGGKTARDAYNFFYGLFNRGQVAKTSAQRDAEFLQEKKTRLAHLNREEQFYNAVTLGQRKIVTEFRRNYGNAAELVSLQGREK